MTEARWQEGKDLLFKIDEYNKREDEIKKLIDRMEKIVSEVQKTVKIQLGEGYVHTPQAHVDIMEFRDFLNAQLKKYDDAKERLWNEFYAL